MHGWTFYDYVAPGNRIPFLEWMSELPPDAQARIDAQILTMSNLEKWSEKWVSKYKTVDEIFELRITFKKVQYRPLGTYARNWSFVLLGGGIEKDGKIPKSVIDAVQVRQQTLEASPHYVRPHQLY